MSAIAITQLPVGSTPAPVQRLRVHPRTGRVNCLFLNEGERKNDGTYKSGSELQFALLESNSGDADDWTLMTAADGVATATAAASNANGIALTVDTVTNFAANGYVAVTGADVSKLNGVFRVFSASSTTMVLETPWDDASHSGLTGATVTEVDAISVKPGGSETTNFITQKKFVQINGWAVNPTVGATTDGTPASGGYCRLDLQFQGIFNFGQIDIEPTATKQGFGFDGNGAAGVGGLGRDTAWPETP